MADRLREIGNKSLAEGDQFEALIKFNESLCFAITGSASMAYAYANRSAVYLDLKLYKNCLNNIQLARQNGYPEEKMGKLIDRENRCKRLMSWNNQEPMTSPWDFFKLSYEPNPKIPFLASCLEMSDDNEFGPHFITNRDLKSGDFIAITDGALKFIDPQARLHRCSWCVGDFLLDLIPCTGCPMGMFCSDECTEKGEQHLHYKWCSHHLTKIKRYNDILVEDHEKHFMRYSDCSLSSKSMSRVFAIFGADAANFFVSMESKSIKAWNYFDFDWSSMDKESYDKNLLMISLAKHKNRVHSLNYKAHGSNLPQCLSDAVQKMSSINLVLSRSISKPLEKSKVGAQEIPEPAIVSNMVGFIMSPIDSFTMISCASNCATLTIDNKVVLMVLRPMKAGDKITVSCGQTFADTDKQQRQEIIKKLFGKDCQCIACVGNWKRIFGSIIKLNPSTSQENARLRFSLKTKDIDRTVSENNPSAPQWLLLESIQLDANILAKPAPFYP